MKRPVQQQECAPARWARALGGALLLWAVLLTGARAEGRVVLGNGAAVEWRVEATEADPRLGLAIPAFTRWTREGFEDPVAIAVRSDALAAIDAWDVSFYRLGDTDFSRPVWRKRGTGATFGDPLEWDGVAASGPPLRPGETVVARLSVRDVAGNIDRAEPQEMLVARYIMSRERRAVSTLDAARQRALPEGEAVEQVPLRGYALILTVTDWPDAAGPGASGARFQQKGDDWVLRQILPSGPHDIVVQSLRPIMGGTRAIPVGVVTVEIPSVSPFHAQIKGTGALDKVLLDPDPASPDGFVAEALVSGAQALPLMLTERQGRRDRLALALIAPDRPVVLAKDERQRRALRSWYDSGTASWPGRGGGGREGASLVASESGLRTTVTYSVPMGAELFLPHTDIKTGSVYLSIEDGAPSPVPDRDYFVNTDQGRVLLGEPVLERLRGGVGLALTVSYIIPSHATVLTAGTVVPRGGMAYDEQWGSPAPTTPRRPAPTLASEEGADPGLLGRAMQWMFGNGEASR